MPFFSNLRSLSREYKPFWKEILFSQIMVFIYAVAILLIPQQIANIINIGILQNNYEAVVSSASYIFLFAVIAGVARMVTIYMASLFSEGTAHAIREIVFEKIQGYSFANMDKHPVGETMVRLTNDVKEVTMAVQYAIKDLFTSVLQILIAIGLVYYFSPSLTWIMLLIIPLLILVLGTVAYKIEKLYKLRQVKLDSLNEITQENLSGVRIVKAFVRQNYEIQHFDKSNVEVQDTSLAPLKVTSFMFPSLLLIIGLSTGFAVLVGGNQVLEGTMDVGELVAFTQYVMAIVGQSLTLSLVIPQLYSAETSAGRLLHLATTEPAVKDADQKEIVAIEEPKGRVVFENVIFSYHSDLNNPTVNQISFIAEPGETVALLGATGSGKSTIVNLLPRFYDVTSGKVTLDGVDIRLIPQHKLRQMVGVALQESVLFSGTIQDNIAFGRPDASFEDVEESAKASDAHGFVEAIPEKYAGRVARRGANFSGGQRQRLSIARALTLKPKVLILDDSTSAVDVNTETKIQTEIAKLLKGTTVFIVAQRISTVLMADKIVLLRDGQIEAIGNHKRLMETSQLYRDIFESQLGGLKMEDVT